MTDIIFSFDTEDYVNPNAAEGILNAARLLREEGVCGCFNVVGLLAEALVEWGRQDIIDELRAHHEICLHSHRHSMHPTINEYSDLADPHAAIAAVIEDESRAIEKITRIFNWDQPIITACPPGISTSYAAHYAYAKMGFRIYDGDTLYDERQSRPVFACNLASLRYNIGLAKILFAADEAFIRDYVEKYVIPSDTFVFYHHPQLALVSQYCDVDNFNGVNTPKEQWVPAKLRDPEAIEKFYRNFRYLVRLVKNDPRCNLTTYNAIAKKYDRERIITPAMLPDIRAQLDAELFPVTTPESLSLADIALACRDFLCGKDRHVCGEVYGFVDTPYAVTEPTTLTADEVRIAAQGLHDGEFLPEFLVAGDKRIGVADWLRAALAVLVEGAETYTVMPGGAWQIDLDQFPELRDTNYKGTWMHTKEFEDRYLSHRFRLQSWTIRLPKGTERKIF